MATNNRDACISITLGYEGGYTNHPSDPGGPTNWGITIHDARMYWKPDATAEDVKAMPKAVAIDIYRQKYWAKMHCDERPAGCDLVDFDLGSTQASAARINSASVSIPSSSHPSTTSNAQSPCVCPSCTASAPGACSVEAGARACANVEARGVRMALGADGKPLAPALSKEAKDAFKKAAGNAGGATGTAAAPASQLPDVSSIDTTTKVGLIVLGVVVVLGITYFVWHAVQNYHRSQAYKAAAA
jgi:hypothetical protein